MTDLAAIEQKLDNISAQIDALNIRTNPPALMTTQECAQLLQVTTERLYQWRREGGGPKWCQPRGTRTLRYRREDVLDWMRGE